MIKDYRIENLRSLVDTGTVPLRPITILLGGNSSGKSTFLRSFPLYTQSVSKQLRNALAWFDEALVDFGDFSTARSVFGADKPIRFTFGIDNEELREWGDPYVNIHPMFYYKESNKNLFRNSSISMSYGLGSDGKSDILVKVELNLEYGNAVSFDFKEKGQVSVKVNGEPWTLADIGWLNSEPGLFFPNLINTEKGVFKRYFSPYRLSEAAVEPLQKMCSSKVSHFEKLNEIVNLWTPDKEKCLAQFRKFRAIKSLSNNIKNWTVENGAFLEVYNNILGYNVLMMWQYLSSVLGRYFINCEYVAPLRAEANRFYRNQGLQVNRIDAYGRNLSEFLSSLTPTQRDSYNEFIRRTLRININVRNSLGHQSLTLSLAKVKEIPEKDKEHSGGRVVETNMTDTGFGYSQILPILTKLWHMQERTRFNSLAFYKTPMATALIEQPELHLHPGLQALLADAFVRAAINTEAKSNIVLETHSPTIINRIGRRIREGHLPKESVSVVLFEKDEEGKSDVRSTGFNDKGQLVDWPYGFFEPANDTF